MSSDSQPSTPQSAPIEPVVVETRIDDLKLKYQFIDTFQQSKTSKHYIVQDIESNYPDGSAFFFLKQTIYNNEPEFRFAHRYYKDFMHYCRSPCAKSDIIKLHQILTKEDPENNYFEMVLVMDIGEPDRIDIENIQVEQITKFLKTVCSLLEDIKKQENLYHGNISLKNIVLMSGELKLSGFKPIFLQDNVKGWKKEICARYNHFRADLFMVGLLWLRFLGMKTEEITPSERSLEEVEEDVKALQKRLPLDKKVTIISALLELEKNPELTLEDVIRMFEEWFVLDHLQKSTNAQNSPLNVFDLEAASQSENNSALLRQKNDGDNIFMQAIQQSEEDRSRTEREDQGKGAKFHGDYLKIDGEFTLQEEDSILQPANNVKRDSLGVQKKHSESLEKVIMEPQQPGSVNSERNVLNSGPKPEEQLTSARSLKNANHSSADHLHQGQFKRETKAEGLPKPPELNEELIKVQNDGSVRGSSTSGLRSGRASDRPDGGDEGLTEGHVDILESPVANRKSESKRETNLSQNAKRESERQLAAQTPKQDWIDTKHPPQKAELSQRQLEELEQDVIQDYLDKKDNLKKEAVESIRNIQDRHEAAEQQAEKIKQNIQILSEKKVAMKKPGKPTPNPPTQKPDNKSPRQTQAVPQPISKKLEKTFSSVAKSNDQSNVKSPLKEKEKSKEKVKEQYPQSAKEPAPVTSQKPALPLTTKPKMKQYGMLNDPKKAFGFSSVKDRDQLFSYTMEMQNKNISFKKMLNKVEPLQKQPSIEGEHKVHAQMSAEPSKVAQTTNLTQLVADKTQQLTQKVPVKQPPKMFGEIRAQISHPSLIDYASRLQEQTAVEPKSEPEMPSTLEEKNLNPEQLTELEDNVKRFLEANEPAKAAEAMRLNFQDVEYLPQIQLQIYTRFYSYFKEHNDLAGKAAALYDIIELLSANPDLDPEMLQQQALTIELAKIETQTGHPENAAKILYSRAFEDRIVDPEAYYELLGETLLLLKDNKAATKSFEKLLNEVVSESFVHFDATRLFMLIFKVFQLLQKNDTGVKLARFFLKMLAVLQDICRVNKVLSLRDNEYQNLVEIYVLNTLRFASERNNFNFINFVLHEVVSKDLLNVEENYNDTERRELVDIIIKFCGHLASIPDLGGFRDNYLAYLEYGQRLFKACDLTAESLKKELGLSFTLALYLLRIGEYSRAQSTIDKCVTSYFSFFKKPDKGVLEVLFELGENLARRGKTAESIFYFEKLLENKCEDQQLRNQALKELSMAQFKVGGFAKAIECVNLFMDHHFEKREAGSYWKYLTLKFVATIKANPKGFDSVFKELAEQEKIPGNKVFGFYLKTFKSLAKIFDSHHEFKENQKYLEPIEEIAKSEKTVDANSAKLAQIFAELYFKFIENQQGKVQDSYKTFLRQFTDSYLTVGENAHLLLNYILNTVFAILCILPTFKERNFTHEQRLKLFESFKKNVSKGVLKHTLDEDIKRSNFNQAAKIDTVKSSVIVASKRAANAVESAVFPLNKSPSVELLTSVTKDPAACTCKAAYGNSSELQSVAKDFLKHIKESLAKDQFDDVLAYYSRFEKTMTEAQLSFQKFEFIKLLITFHLVGSKKGPVDSVRFTELLKQMFAAQFLCWHDLKLIVLLLESFKDPAYLRYFSEFLDSRHPNYAKLTFNDIFLNSFNRKFQRLIDHLYQSIQNNRFSGVENHFFVRHLQFDEFGRQPLDVDFTPLGKLRYEVMSLDALIPLFNRHVNYDNLSKFYLRYHLFLAMREAVLRTQPDQNQVLRKFKNDLLHLLISLKVDESHTVDLLYQLLLLAHLIRFDSPDEMSDSFLKLINFLLERYNEGTSYQYSRVLSELAKLFYRSGNFKAAVKALFQANALLDENNKVHVYEPKYVVAPDRETHIFSLLVWTVAAFLESKKVENANIYLQRLEYVKTENEILKLDRNVLVVMRNLGQKRSSDAMRIIINSMNNLPKLNLTDLQKRLYAAIFDKLSLWTIQLTEANETELKKSEAKARDSNLRLYEDN